MNKGDVLLVKTADKNNPVELKAFAQPVRQRQLVLLFFIDEFDTVVGVSLLQRLLDPLHFIAEIAVVMQIRLLVQHQNVDGRHLPWLHIAHICSFL
ncbi:hypothetical protein D3C73_1130660 [compost metagenome]